MFETSKQYVSFVFRHQSQKLEEIKEIQQRDYWFATLELAVEESDQLSFMIPRAIN